MGKIQYKCEFGVIHQEANCRCTSNHVENRQVKCDKPEEHTKRFVTEVELGRKVERAIYDAISDFFGDVLPKPVDKWKLTDKIGEAIVKVNENKE